MNIYFTDLIKRICQEAQAALRNNTDGHAIVTVHIVLNTDNKPVLWCVNTGKRIEPSNDSGELLRILGG